MSSSSVPTPPIHRSGSRVELISTILIAVAIMFGGRAMLEALTRFTGIAGAVLFVIVLAQAASLLRTLRLPATQARMLATRDITALVAALLSLTAVLTHGSWAIGAAIAAAEFTCVLEAMRHLQPPSTLESEPAKS